jgi:hypothetical protein
VAYASRSSVSSEGSLQYSMSVFGSSSSKVSK